MKQDLKAFDWSPLHSGSVDHAVDHFYDVLTRLCENRIPHETLTIKNSSHPWMDDKCYEAVRRKNEMENTDGYEEESEKWARILAHAYDKHVEKLKIEIAGLKKNDKKWWRLN